ncbi:hypothetical protein BXZ70DRAFT_241913 [Cristinia sonorae]|uniref:F-box domain-containing protein n=1 Tax=Cristinia sonorae TaxID=1940300 RepID=A0A8K0ULQ5_9AGAR|nr:hypothetical protein BXZ70DRAFT_241913 [Cristinia sonorae]
MSLNSPIPEILAMILDHLRDDTPSLTTCTAVSQTWRTYTLPLLFHTQKWTIKSSEGPFSYASLSKLLNEPGNGVAPHVVILEIVSELFRPYMASSRAGRPPNAYLTPSLFASIISPLTSLRTLTLRLVSTLSYPDDDPSGSPRRELHLEQFHVSSMQADGATILAFLRKFTSIGEFIVSHVLLPSGPPDPDDNMPTTLHTILHPDRQLLYPYVSRMKIKAKVPIDLRNCLYDVFFHGSAASSSGPRSLETNFAMSSNPEELFYVGERVHASQMRLERLSLDILDHYIFWAERFIHPSKSLFLNAHDQYYKSSTFTHPQPSSPSRTLVASAPLFPTHAQNPPPDHPRGRRLPILHDATEHPAHLLVRVLRHPGHDPLHVLPLRSRHPPAYHLFRQRHHPTRTRGVPVERRPERAAKV